MGVNISPATPYVQIHDIQSHQTDLESPQMEVGVRRDKSTLLKGMLLALISGILFTANNFVLVYAAVSPLDAVLVRGLVHSMVLGLYYRSSIWCEKVHLVILQGYCAKTFFSSKCAVSFRIKKNLFYLPFTFVRENSNFAS